MHDRGDSDAQAVVLFLTRDLTFSSRLNGAAARNGVSLHVASDPAELIAAAAASGASLVVLDLTTPGLELETLLPPLRQAAGDTTPIIAYGPHVQEAKLAAATAAGCDEVLSRGEFNARMDEILGRCKG